MRKQTLAKIVPFKDNDNHCLQCGIKNSPANHFCRSCGKVVNHAAKKLAPEKCLHELVRGTRLYIFNYCPTCREPIMSISDDDCGLMI